MDNGHSNGWDIDLVFQPPNSPDFNVFDLGYFNANQSSQKRFSTKNLDEVINLVQRSSDKLMYETLDIFLSVQKPLESQMKAVGDNDYKLAYISKSSKELKWNSTLSNPAQYTSYFSGKTTAFTSIKH